MALRPRVRERLSARVIGGELVVLDRDGGRVHQFNATATYIWGRCDGRFTESEIAEQMAVDFDVAPEQAVSDVSALVVQLRELGLLELGR